MPSSHILQERKPADSVFESYPLGNGRLGALVFGKPREEQILLNHENLWSGSPDSIERPDGTEARERRMAALAEAREMLRQGRYLRADRIVEERLQGHFGESYLPLGTMVLRFRNADGSYLDEAEDYRCARSLDLKSALSIVVHRSTRGTVRVEQFISNPDKIFSTRISSDIPVDIELTLDSPLKVIDRHSQGDCCICRGQAPDHLGAFEDNEIRYGGNGILFDMELRIHRCDGIRTPAEKGLAIQGFTEMEIRFSAETSYTGHRKPFLSFQRLRVTTSRILDSASSLPHGQLFQRHAADYQTLYNAVELSIVHKSSESQALSRRIEAFRRNPSSDPKLLILYFNYSRYLLISSSRGQGQPANLQGLWSWDLRAPWCSNWTLNVNLPMNYWMASACGLDDCVSPLLALIDDLSRDGAVTAANHYSCRGWTCNHNSDLWRKTVPVEGSPMWAYWPVGGIWMALIYTDRYRYTLDQEFLTAKLLPVLCGSVDFALDWLQEDGDGMLQTLPSTSPENLFTTVGGGDKFACGISSAMDLFLIRELFSAYLQTAANLGLSDKRQQEVQEALERLPVPGIDTEGRLKEWTNDFREVEPGHRHLSPLISVYPFSGLAHSGANTPNRTELLQAARELFLHRTESYFDELGWSGAWASLIASRLSMAERAWGFLCRLISRSSFNNLMNSHSEPSSRPSDWIFQIDGNFGGAAAVLEMIVSDYDGEIRLLPALPPEWASGTLSGLRLRGALTMNLEWGKGRVSRVSVTAHQDSRFVLLSGQEMRIAEGQRAQDGAETTASEKGWYRRSCALRKGETLRMFAAG